MGNNLKLYYFTDSYPFGLGETWKFNELNILKNHFNEYYPLASEFKNEQAIKIMDCMKKEENEDLT